MLLYQLDVANATGCIIDGVNESFPNNSTSSKVSLISALWAITYKFPCAISNKSCGLACKQSKESELNG
jgi:hypothetical protein